MDWEDRSIKQKTGIYEPGNRRTALYTTSLAYRVLMLPVALLIVILFPVTLLASNIIDACEHSPITINTIDLSVNHKAICDSAEDALVFFDRLGARLSHPLVIEIVQNLPDGMSKTAVGCYDEEDQKVSVLTFTEFQKRQVWGGVPRSRLMYRSLVTHEVAHALASCNFKIPKPTYHAEEYLAYVAMFAMMNPELRKQLLEEISEVGFDSEYEFNEITYSLDPMRFGAEAYSHYLKKEHGDAFLLKILAGNALTNSVDDLP